MGSIHLASPAGVLAKQDKGQAGKKMVSSSQRSRQAFSVFLRKMSVMLKVLPFPVRHLLLLLCFMVQ